MKTGLVLEGGAMRGMYTCGVLDVFLENGIEADGVIGVSAGALFGINYVSRQKERPLRYSKRYNGNSHYLGLIPLLKEGNIVSQEMAFDRLPKVLDPFDDDTFQASSTRFYSVATDIETGEPEYTEITDSYAQMEYLRASGSMPFVSRPVEIEGRKFLDGGISDSIPYEWMAGQGYDKIVVILTRDLSYIKTPMASAPIKVKYRRYPAFAKRLANRHEEYNASTARLKEWEKEGKAFVIRPSAPITIGKLEKDPDKLQAVYYMGRRDALSQLKDLKAYLNLDTRNE